MSKIIYKCFSTKSLLDPSDGYFELGETRLKFYIIHGGIIIDKYAYIDMQIKDITSICANYIKRLNVLAFIIGTLLSSVGAILKFFIPTPNWLPMPVVYVILGIGGFLLIGSVSFLRIKMYKINIGTHQGGITLMGSSSRMKNTVAWNNPMTVVYNATPIEKGLIKFIEDINKEIEARQLFGDYAAQDC